jgi:cephalosporin-C deacetylase-like acetyl esterase
MQAPRSRSLGKTARGPALAILLLAFAPLLRAQEGEDFRKLAADVLAKEQRADARGMIDRDIQRRTDAFNVRHREEWYKIKTRDQWETYRDERIARLRRSLGDFPQPGNLNTRVTGVVKGDGFHIENVVFESLPGNWVAGNLYVPAKPGRSMPGILIAHAHHGGKRDGELQDMGMLWARAGCLVLVIDQVGYGERRSHPFSRDADYAKPYKTSRQDYYFRYDTGVQLQLLGDSLMGWMAWDQMRGVDLLLSKDGVDPKRIILLGAVAGGGDPAGVTAALDPRIACCVPFNFGGPQPETKYPLPDDAETRFNYLLFTYWDSTRGLRLGASGDFPHWLIVASTAPRYLIHGHEFAWDGERDPVWKRYQKIWGDFYGQADHLGVAHGKGGLKLRPPEGSHCNNIGAFHRQMIHPLFERWFGVKAPEYSMRRPGTELVCWTEQARKELQPKSLNESMAALGSARIAKARGQLADKTPEQQRRILREEWGKLIGPVTPTRDAAVKSRTTDQDMVGGAKVERIVLEVEPGISVPLLLLIPAKVARKAPVVVGLSATGRAAFLKQRSSDLQQLIEAGVLVALPDVRGTGETRSGSPSGRDSNDTNHSVHVQLFGETLLGQRLRDLRSVLAYLRGRADVDPGRIALWGESFTPANGPKTDYQVPHGVEGGPAHAEPLGGLLALLGALHDDQIRAVHVAGGLSGYRGALAHFAVLVPHGDAVPGALTAGDLCDLAGGLAPRPLRLEGLVDAMNRVVPDDELRREYAPVLRSYRDTPGSIRLSSQRTSAATWLAERVR